MKNKSLIVAGIIMFIAWIACFSFAHAQNLQTVTLQPGPEGKDTYICDCLPNVNNPNGPITNLYQGQYGACYDRILIQWDLSSLPKNISVSNAIMELKCNTIYGSISGKMAYYRISGEWEETKVTCTTIPNHSGEDSVITNWPSSGQWHAVDITKFVQKWMKDTTTNHGVYGHCIGTTGECDCEFSSSDVSTSANRPKLTIIYTTTSKVEHLGASRPLDFHLGQNYPNPFNPISKIQYSIPHNEFVSLKVFDLLGKEVVTLVAQRQDAGMYEALFDGSHLTSEIYIYQLRAGNFNDTKKMILIK
ncbi:MAG: DNRLRE domain-containing protein [Ignavibacteriales bacterium]|nr:DNRLRE domain-containing protein [Ignavibacteriales bacterium]